MHKIITIIMLIVLITPIHAAHIDDVEANNDIAWNKLGPSGGGWYESLAFDPVDGDTLYVGTDLSGFLISTDGGISFESRNNGLTDYFVEKIAVHPTNTDIIVIATKSGVFKTENKGLEWTKVLGSSSSTSTYSAPINVVYFDPTNSSIIYAGQGITRGDFDDAGVRSGNIYKSNDTGSSWTTITLPDTTAIINDIVVSSLDNRDIMVATDQGLYRSTDSGSNWEEINNFGSTNTDINRLAIARTSADSESLYITLKTTARIVYEEDDEGNILYDNNNNPITITETWDGGIFRSDDFGTTWTDLTGDFPKIVDTSAGATSTPKDIVVDPQNTDITYVANYCWNGRGIYKCDTSATPPIWENLMIYDGSVITNFINGWAQTNIGAPFAFAIKPGDSSCIVEIDAMQINKTTDSGANWSSIYYNEVEGSDELFTGNGADILTTYDIVFDPEIPDRIYFCYWDVGLLISDDRGKTYRQAAVTNKDDVITVIIEKDTDSIWALNSRHPFIQVSTDDGYTWTDKSGDISENSTSKYRNLVAGLQTAVADRNYFITSTEDGILKWDSSTSTWVNTSNGLPTIDSESYPGVNPRSLLIDPNNNNHLITAYGGLRSDGGGIYQTYDAGQNWSLVHDSELDLFNNIQSLNYDPANFSVLYLAHRETSLETNKTSGVYRSIDGGVTWECILTGSTTDCISEAKVNPFDSNTIYALFSAHPFHDDPVGEGVLKSKDHGITWEKINNGLPILNTNVIAVNPHCPEELYLGTAGACSTVAYDTCPLPLNHYKFDDENDSGLDSSSFSHNATLNGDTIITDGLINKSIEMTSGDSLTIQRENSPYHTREVTISTWINLQERGSSSNTFIMYKPNSHYLKLDWWGNASFAVYIDGTNYSTATTALPFDEWVHLTGKYNCADKTLELYVNGVLTKSKVITATLDSYEIDDNENNITTTISGTARTILLDDLRLYNYAVNEEDIVDIADKDLILDIDFNLPETDYSVNDNSAYGNTGTITGDTSYQYNQQNGNALEITAGNVSFPAESMPEVTDSLTIAGWVYIGRTDDGTTNKDNSNIFSKSESFNLLVEWYRQLRFGVYLNGSYHSVTQAATIGAESWYHVAGTYDQATQTLSLYINGTLVNSNILSEVSIYPIDTNNNPGFISSTSSNGRIAQFDNIKVYKRALTQEEIYNHMILSQNP